MSKSEEIPNSDFRPSGSTSEPVFVLGSPRSATSVLAQSLGEVGWSGFGEGHIFDLLADLVKMIDRKLYDHLSTSGTTAWAIDQFPLTQLQAGLVGYFEAQFVNRFGARWIDKTPGPESIMAAPTLLRMFPRAKFVFCHRRGLDVIASATRRFGDGDQTVLLACDYWVDSMMRWQDVKENLGRTAIELEHHDLTINPAFMANKIKEHLGLDPPGAESLESYFVSHWPEQTSMDRHNLKLSEAPWPDSVKKYVLKKSRFCMSMFGYGFEEPFVDIRPPRPIMFTRDPAQVDLSGVGDPGFYKELGPELFLLHPGPSDRPVTSVRFKNLAVGHAHFLMARAAIAHHLGGHVVCDMEILVTDQVVAHSSVDCAWGRDAVLSVDLPHGHPHIDLRISTRMAEAGGINNFAWCNIIGLKFVEG